MGIFCHLKGVIRTDQNQRTDQNRSEPEKRSLKEKARRTREHEMTCSAALFCPVFLMARDETIGHPQAGKPQPVTFSEVTPV